MGVVLYNALTGHGYDAEHYEEFDNCPGHTSPNGAYHYHQLSRKIHKKTNDYSGFINNPPIQS